MDFILPRVIGHRGARGYAPENTLAGFHTAADLGIEWVEFDVKLSKDGEPMVFHDDDLLRITGHEGLFKDMNYEDLIELDAGSHFGESFIGEKIPHLEEVLEVCMKRNMGVNIEIKPCNGREIETAETVLDFTSRIWSDDMPPPLISSFQYPCLETAMDMAGNWPRGFLIDESKGRIENWREMVKYLDPFSINCNGNAISDEDFVMYLETGRPVLAYTINDPDIALRLFDMGMTAVFSDVPDVIRDILNQ